MSDVSNDLDQCSAVVNGLAATIADNCGVVLSTWSMTGATSGMSSGSGINDISGTSFNVGTTTVTYYIEDAAGNSAQCEFDVVVNDTQNPTFTCGTPAPSYIADLGFCYYTILDGGLDPTLDSDNCGVASIVNDFTGTNTLSGAQFPVGITNVEWTITDIHGNTFTCDYDIEVLDSQVPTISCPADANVSNDLDQCDAVVNGLSPTTADNCAVTLQTWSMAGATGLSSPGTGINDVSGQTFNVGTTTVTYYIEDASGNSAQCNFDVVVNDTQLHSDYSSHTGSGEQRP